MKKFKRNFLHRDEYLDNEKEDMAQVHTAHKAAFSSDEIPAILQMNDDWISAKHRMTPDEVEQKTWTQQLGEGLLSDKADMMIGMICDYLQSRLQRILSNTRGNFNDPRNLVLLRMLEWLTKTLSRAECNQDTLDMINRWIIYLDKLRDTFPPEDLFEKRMVAVFDDLKTIFQSTLSRSIRTEMANTHASEDLEDIEEMGKIILNLDYEIGYYVMTNIPDLPTADMLRFRKQDPSHQRFGQSKLGQTLLAAVRTREYKQFFACEHEKTPTTTNNSAFRSLANPREMTLEDTQITNNPYLGPDNNICIPYAVGQGKDIKTFLKNDNKKKDTTGIYPAFLEDGDFMKTYLYCRVIAIELSKLFLICRNARILADLGGTLFVYGFSNVEITRTMDNLKLCCSTLKLKTEALVAMCNIRLGILTDTGLSENPEHIVWTTQFKKVNSLLTQLIKYLDKCSEQASFIIERAKLVLTEEWQLEAEQQSKDFVESAMKVNLHITHFLEGKPTPDFDPSMLPWNKPLALPPESTGGPTIEVLDDDSERGNAGRKKLSRKFRNSLRGLFAIGKQTDDAHEDSSQTESKQEQFKKTGRKSSIKDLFAIGKQSDDAYEDSSQTESKQAQFKKAGRKPSIKDFFSLAKPGHTADKESESLYQNEAQTEPSPDEAQRKQTAHKRRGSMGRLFKLGTNPGKEKSPVAQEGVITESPATPSTPPKAGSSLDRRRSSRRLSQLFTNGSLNQDDSSSSTELSTVIPASLDNSTPGNSSSLRAIRKKPVDSATPPSIKKSDSDEDSAEISALTIVVAEPPKSLALPPAAPIVKPPRLTVEFNGDKSSYLDDNSADSLLGDVLRGRPLASEVQLRKNQITANKAEVICTILTKHTPLKKLNLSGNKKFLAKTETFGPHKYWVGASAVSTLLQSHPNLEEIELIDCGLTSPGACGLSNGLTAESRLKMFDLSHNPIEDEGAILICNAARKIPKLSTLKLAGCSISGKCTDSIVALLNSPTLEVLDLCNNNLDDNAMIRICEAAKSNPQRSRLNCLLLGSNKLTDACAEAIYSLLKENPKIQYFSAVSEELSEAHILKIEALLDINRKKTQATETAPQTETEDLSDLFSLTARK